MKLCSAGGRLTQIFDGKRSRTIPSEKRRRRTNQPGKNNGKQKLEISKDSPSLHRLLFGHTFLAKAYSTPMIVRVFLVPEGRYYVELARDVPILLDIRFSIPCFS